MNMSRADWAVDNEASDPFSLDEDLSALLPPTAVALVKGAWSKFVTFDELMVELFFERLLVDAPGLVEQFGLAIDAAPQELLQLIDISVRALEPRTENMLKEGYRAAPSAAGARSKSRADCAAFFATYDVTRAQWELARDAFLWAFQKIPASRRHGARGPRRRSRLGAGAVLHRGDRRADVGLGRIRGRGAVARGGAGDAGRSRADARHCVGSGHLLL